MIMLPSDWLRINLVEPARERRRKEKKQKLEAIEREWAEVLKNEFARGREEGSTEGIAEGRAQMIAEFKDWNRSRLEAQERGEMFAEPPPYPEN